MTHNDMDRVASRTFGCYGDTPIRFTLNGPRRYSQNLI
jgi:hypothetical protein